MAARECRGGFLSRCDDRWRHSLTRREALLSLAGMLAGSPLLRAQLDPRPLKDHRRVPAIDDMMTAFDFEPGVRLGYGVTMSIFVGAATPFL